MVNLNNSEQVKNNQSPKETYTSIECMASGSLPLEVSRLRTASDAPNVVVYGTSGVISDTRISKTPASPMQS